MQFTAQTSPGKQRVIAMSIFRDKKIVTFYIQEVLGVSRDEGVILWNIVYVFDMLFFEGGRKVYFLHVS